MGHGLASGLGQLGLGGSGAIALPLDQPAQGNPVIPEYLAIRVTDINGVEIIRSLPHPHRSHWQVRGFQGATAGNSNVGSFELPLYEPHTAEGTAAAAEYARLDYDQRIEAYLGDVIAGQPRFSGIIREIDRAPDALVVKGASWDYLLSLQTTMRGEAFIGDTRTLARSMTGNWEELWADDFSSGSLANYFTQGGGGNGTAPTASFTPATDPLTGYPAVLGRCTDFNAFGTGGLTFELITNQTFPQSAWDDCIFEALIHFVPDQYAVSPFFSLFAPISIGQVGIVIDASATGTSIVLDQGAALLFGGVTGPVDTSSNVTPSRQLISGTLNVNTRFETGPGPTLWAFDSTAGGIDILAQVTVQGKWTGSQYLWRMLINGIDCGVTTTTSPRPAGNVGIGIAMISSNLGPPAAGVGPTAYVTNLTFRTRAPKWFALGSYGPATKSLSTVISRAGQLDLITQMATVEGYLYRDTPAIGHDVIDWGPGPVPTPAPGVAAIGSDLSQAIVFREGDNLVNATLEPNAETLATDIELTMGATTDTASVHWTNIPAAKVYGILTDFGQSLGTGDVQSDIAWSRALAQYRGAPGVAKTIQVLRDTATADRWRECDYVAIDAPHLGLNMARVLVVGYDFTEGDPTMSIIGDQFPINRLDAVTRRWWTQVAALSEGAMAISPSSFSSPFDSTFGQPQAVTYGAQPVAVSGTSWGPVPLAEALLPFEASFLLHAYFSWTVTGSVTANFSLGFGAVTLETISPDSTPATGYTAGDGGPVDLTATMQGSPGWFTVSAQAATGTGGTGTVSAQLTLIFTARSAL